MDSLRKWSLKKVLISLVLIGFACFMQWILNPIIGEPSFILFYPMVILCSLYGNGWLGIILSALVIQYFFLPPKDHFFYKELPGLIKQFVFLSSSLMIHSLTSALRHTLRHTQKMESRLQVTLDSIGDAVVSTDEEGRIDFMNPVAEAMTEWSLHQAFEKPLSEVLKLIDPVHRRPIDLSFNSILSKESALFQRDQMMVLGKNGRETIIEDSLSPIIGKENHGELSHAQGVVFAFRDVSEKFHKQAELNRVLQHLQESQEQFQKVLQSVLDGVVITDDQNRIMLWNPQAEKILGYSQDQALGLELDQISGFGLNKSIQKDWLRSLNQNVHSEGNERETKTGGGTSVEVLQSERVEVCVRSQKGEWVPLEVVTTPVRTSGGLSVFYFFKDLTAAKQAQLELIEARNKTELILSSAAEGILGVDHEGRIMFVNPAASVMLGWSDSSLIGQFLYDKVHASPHHGVSLGEKNESMGELWGQPAVVHSIQESLAQGTVLHREDEEFTREDGTCFPVEYSSTPMKKGDQIIGLVLTFRDISERKRNEKQIEDLMMQLKQALSARDEFISIASHELKTPLTSLKLHYQLVARQLAVGNTQALSPRIAQARVESTNRQIDRMIRLIDDMLDVSRISSGRLEVRFEEVELNHLIRSLLERFNEDFKFARCSLQLDLKDVLVCRCDPLRIEQVVSNLLMNALKYAASKPIEMRLNERDGFAVIEVRDHGAGIPQEKLSRVFEKFERAVSSQYISGFGLGLYISRKIVEAHHGRIEVESELGYGSLFRVFLPLG